MQRRSLVGFGVIGLLAVATVFYLFYTNPLNALEVRVLKIPSTESLMATAYLFGEPMANVAVTLALKGKDLSGEFQYKTNSKGFYKDKNLYPASYLLVLPEFKNCKLVFEIGKSRQLTSITVNIDEGVCSFSMSVFKGIPSSFYSD